MGWWVADLANSGQYVQLISWIFWVIFSITLHELGHGWAALRQGDRTPEITGHMTWNPWIHMGPISLLMFAIIGICWGLMPVDPSRFRDGRLGRAKVAAAGPAMNFGLAFISAVLMGVVVAIGSRAGGMPSGGLLDNLATFFFVGGFLNIALALFNLIPAPPLDGSNILAGLSWRAWQLYQHPNAQFAGLAVVMLMLITGAMGAIFGVGIAITNGIAGVVASVLS
jgi:Zn-dependent protease